MELSYPYFRKISLGKFVYTYTGCLKTPILPKKKEKNYISRENGIIISLFPGFFYRKIAQS